MERDEEDTCAAEGPDRPEPIDSGEGPRTSPEPDGLNRRRFLWGTGVVAATAGLIHGARPAEAGQARPAVLGPGKVAREFLVNGRTLRAEVEPRTTLAEALRLELGLTGTKVACDRGSCSACTIWVDSTPVCACTTFALDVGGRAITTIEGLARGGALHPVQQAFIDHDAMQCGFCTPGMVMSCAALLARVPSPGIDDVRAATSGNLCRCGTYPKVFAATLAAAGSPGPARPASTPAKKG